MDPNAVPMPPTVAEALPSVTPPVPPAPPVEGQAQPDEAIKIVEAPPPAESIGTPEFRTPSTDELTQAGFPPEPPLETPRQEPVAEAAEPPPPVTVTVTTPVGVPANVRGVSSEQGVDGSAGDFRTGGGTQIRDTGPVPIPSPPAFDDLPEKTRAELMAGHLALGRSEASFRFVQPLDRQDVTTQPHAPAAIPSDAPKDEEIEWSKLPERTRAELQAGRDRLASKRADYQEVRRREAEQRAKDLADGKVGDMSYPAG